MKRRSIRLATLILLLAATTARAQVQMLQAPQPAAPVKPPSNDELFEIPVSPKAGPVPGFRYRLMPLDSERTAGDAAPIYLRLVAETAPERLKLLADKPFEWLRLPLDQFPVAEARAFVDGWKFRLQQLEYGTRRKTCDWNYTLEEEKDHAFEILLPDAQQMRTWGRLIALKARVEMAEGKLDDSARTIETGLAFSRHIADGPFLINSMIAIAIARTMLERVDELIARPDAPNLYWALTALPRPLIGVRQPFDNELKMVDWMFPELGEVNRARSPADWSSILGRFHERMANLISKPGAWDPELIKGLRFEADLARFRSKLLPEARADLESKGNPTAGMSEDQVLMRFFVGRIREVRDEWARPFYLPFAEAAPIYAAITKRYLDEKTGPMGLFVSLAPTVEASHAAETRLERKVASLRAVEAIRMQAAADHGRFPESLAEVTVVPVPLDPSGGKPFTLRRDGEALVLGSGPIYDGHMTYRLIPRK